MAVAASKRYYAAKVQFNSQKNPQRARFNMTKRKLIIATRESALALKQAELVKIELLKHHPQLTIEFLGITTEADKQLNITLAKIGGKGLFVKELEEALYAGRADIAAHSMKDVPMNLPPGMTIPAICERDDPRDAFVANQYRSLQALPSGASIGTSSLRRKTQIAILRNDLTLRNLRGNIQTRLKHLDHGDYDALILASSGLRRLGLANRIKTYLPIEESLPAAGQGALGIECREDNETVLALVKPLNHLNTYLSVCAERALCRRLGGGCMVPIASYAEIHHHILTLQACIASLNGKQVLRAHLSGDPNHAEKIGTQVAERLLNLGAEKLLKEFVDLE